MIRSVTGTNCIGRKDLSWLADFGYKGRACDHAGLPCKVARAICRAGSEMMMAGRLPVHVADHQVEAFCMLAAMRPPTVPSPTNPTTTLSLDITSPSLRFTIFDRHREASCAAHIEEGPACAKGEMRDELGGHAASVLAVQSPAAHITLDDGGCRQPVIEWQSTCPANWPAAS